METAAVGSNLAQYEINGEPAYLLKMAFLKGLFQFSSRAFKKYDPEAISFVDRAGWSHFRSFAADSQKYYSQKKERQVAFAEIIELERTIFPEFWGGLSQADQAKVQRIATELDSNPDLFSATP